MRDRADTALQHRYFVVVLPHTEALVSVEVGTNDITTLECTNREFCYYSHVLRCGKCPHTCQVLVETKNYIYGRRKTKAGIFEVGGLNKDK